MIEQVDFSMLHPEDFGIPCCSKCKRPLPEDFEHYKYKHDTKFEFCSKDCYIEFLEGELE